MILEIPYMGGTCVGGMIDIPVSRTTFRSTLLFLFGYKMGVTEVEK